MCLILVAWRRHARTPLVVAANRDEFHARPASPAAFWKDTPAILAGRDLQAQGTWLGVARNGRFAAVTNVRGERDPDAPESRGALVSGFLAGRETPASYVEELNGRKARFSGFNLLVADGNELWWLSNRGNGARRLEPGCYALGNELLDTPEVQDIKQRFEATPALVDPLFSLLAGAKIVAPAYGTRCSSIVLQGAEGDVQFAERPFDPTGADGATLRFEFRRAA